MENKIKILIITLTISILALGCSVKIPKYVLTNECTFPCWHGIYPNKTTLEESRRIIEGWNFVKSISKTVGRPDESQRIFINVNNSDSQIEVKFENYIVDYIYIELPKQTVNHYIDELGDPSLIGYGRKGFGLGFIGDVVVRHIYLIYPEKGIILYVYATKDDKVNGDCNTVGLIITDIANLNRVVSILDEGNEVNYVPWPDGKY
jgi:hypothetical protein